MAYIACLNILRGCRDIGNAWLVCKVIESLRERYLIREGREIRLDVSSCFVAVSHVVVVVIPVECSLTLTLQVCHKFLFNGLDEVEADEQVVGVGRKVFGVGGCGL